MGKLKSRKWQIIIALILVVVILLVSAVGSIISLIIAILDTEQKDEAGLYTETRLYVRALQGKWDGTQKHSYNSDNKKDVPINELKVTLTPDKGLTTDSKKKTVTDERSSIAFDPTNAEGISYVVLDSGGLGALTMSTGNDTYYGIGGDGRPTKHYKLIAKGTLTFYDSYSYVGADDTGLGHSYNLNIPNGKTTARTSNSNVTYGREKNSPSDSWHIAGVMKNPYGGVTYDGYKKARRERKTSPHLLYAWSPNGYSYGACLGADTGGGTHGVLDMYFPFNKYYGKYGYNHKKGAGDAGVNGTGTIAGTLYPYLKLIGVKDPYHAHTTWDSRRNEVYDLDDSGDKPDGSTRRGMYLNNLCKHNKAWPTNMTGGTVKQDAKRKDGSTNTMYDIKTILTETGQQKWGNKFENHFSDSAPQDLAKIETHDKADPYIFQCGLGIGPKDRQWVLQFWTETVEVGDGTSSGTYVSTPPYSKPTCYTNGNPYSGPYNCVYYVWGRVNETYGKKLPSWHNAKDWLSNAKASGYKTHSADAQPKPGWIICFKAGINKAGLGHVAFVESVEGNTIRVSESGQHSHDPNKTWRYWKYSKNYNMIAGYIEP